MHVPQLQHKYGAFKTHTATSFCIRCNTGASHCELLTLCLGQSGGNVCQPGLSVFRRGRPDRAQSFLASPVTWLPSPDSRHPTPPVPKSSDHNLPEARPVPWRQPVDRMYRVGFRLRLERGPPGGPGPRTRPDPGQRTAKELGKEATSHLAEAETF